MGKGFVTYLLSCIITLAFGLIFSNVFILFLFFVFLLAPVFSKMMMKLDAKNMKIKIYCAGDSVQGNETLLYLDIISKNKQIYAQGMLYLTLEITYHKYGETRKRHMKVPASKKQGTIKITTLPDLCSGISIKCISVYSEDMLGIIRTDMTPPPPFYFTAFPKQLQVSIAGISQSLISSYNNASQMSRKGSDYTEVREFKDYIPGDSVKAIHWKLSSKLDRTLIKVGSDSTSLKTLIFLNIERASDESDPDENQLLCALLQLGFTVSTGLIENGVSHKICSVTDSGLELYNVLNYEDEITAQKKILASPIPVGKAGGVKRLLFEKGIYNYSKIICICHEGNADEAKKLASFCDVTTMIISQSTELAKTSRTNNAKLIRLPFENIQDNRYSIKI